MPNKPHGHHSVNVSPGTTSHLLLKKRNQFPVVAADLAHPNVGEIFGAVVEDEDAGFFFNAIPIAQLDRKRLALKINSGLPSGGVDPVDGLLTVTLQQCTNTSPLTVKEITVSDVPVDYISDPTAP